jgi:hypothetical protein
MVLTQQILLAQGLARTKRSRQGKRRRRRRSRRKEDFSRITVEALSQLGTKIRILG